MAYLGNAEFKLGKVGAVGSATSRLNNIIDAILVLYRIESGVVNGAADINLAYLFLMGRVSYVNFYRLALFILEPDNSTAGSNNSYQQEANRYPTLVKFVFCCGEPRNQPFLALNYLSRLSGQLVVPLLILEV